MIPHPHQPSRIQVAELLTPEGVTLSFPLATGWERILAFLLDIAFLSLLLTILWLVVAVLQPASGISDPVIAIGIAGTFLVRHGYFVFLEAFWNGATLAKRILGIRVVSRDGGSLEFGAVIARNVLRDAELSLPLLALAYPQLLVAESPRWVQLPATVWILALIALPMLTRETQRAGDLVAGTIVVRVPAAHLLSDEAAPQSRRSRTIRFADQHLSIYGEHELETLASILRDAEKGPIRPEELAIIAATIAQKIQYPGQIAQEEPRRFLRAFYGAQRASLEKQLIRGKRKASKLG